MTKKKYRSFSDEKRIAANMLLARGEDWKVVAERIGHSHVTLRRYCNPTEDVDKALLQFSEDMKLLAKRLNSMPGVWKSRAVDVLGAAEILLAWSKRCGESNAHSKPNQNCDCGNHSSVHSHSRLDGARLERGSLQA